VIDTVAFLRVLAVNSDFTLSRSLVLLLIHEAKHSKEGRQKEKKESKKRKGSVVGEGSKIHTDRRRNKARVDLTEKRRKKESKDRILAPMLSLGQHRHPSPMVGRGKWAMEG
jgi:hypothetical protein